MPETNQSDSIKHQHDHKWIVTPGLRPIIENFIHLYDSSYSPKLANPSARQPLLIYGDPGVGKSQFVHIFKTNYSADYPNNIILAIDLSIVTESELDNKLKKINSGLLIIDHLSDTIDDKLKAKLFFFIDSRNPAVTVVALMNHKNPDFNCFNNRFREFTIPPLCERREDVLYYLYHFCPGMFDSIDDNHILCLLFHNYPDNVNELKNIAFDYLYDLFSFSNDSKLFTLFDKYFKDYSSDYIRKKFFSFPFELDFYTALNSFFASIDISSDNKPIPDSYDPSLYESRSHFEINHSITPNAGLYGFLYYEHKDFLSKYIIALDLLCYLFCENISSKEILFNITKGCGIEDVNYLSIPSLYEKSLNLKSHIWKPELDELREKIHLFRMDNLPSLSLISSDTKQVDENAPLSPQSYKSTFQHDPDYNSFTFKGVKYVLKSSFQSLVLKYMDEHSARKEDLFDQHKILEEIECSSKRLSDVFKGQPDIWINVIYKSGKGKFRINY